MATLEDIGQILQAVLQLEAGALGGSREEPLLGSIPEFDSMAVVSVLTAIEEQYDVIVDDDEISAEAFETLGSLQDFVNSMLEV